MAHLIEVVEERLTQMMITPQMLCQSLESYEDCFLTLGQMLDVATLKPHTEEFFHLYKKYLKENGMGSGQTMATICQRQKTTPTKKWEWMTHHFQLILDQYQSLSTENFDNFFDPDYHLKKPLKTP